MTETDRTVLRPAPVPGAAGAGVRAEWKGPDGQAHAQHFSAGFRLGRHSGCEVCIPIDSVSRHHAEVFCEDGHWWIRDLNSANGTLVGGRRVTCQVLSGRVTVQLGDTGPLVTLSADVPIPAPARRQPPESADERTVLRPSPAAPPPRTEPSVPAGPLPRPSRAASATATPPLSEPAPATPRPGRPAAGGGAGTRAQREQKAVLQREKRLRRWQTAAFGVLGVLLAAAVSIVVWQNQKVERANALAIDLFYDIKTLEVQLARLEDQVRSSKELRLQGELSANRARLKKMLARYQKYVEEAQAPEASLSPEDRVILRMARAFGECELNMPEAFKEEVKVYIRKWQATGRLARGIRTAQENGYVGTIAQALESQDLPPQFFYLGLQESGYNARAVGPPTRWGVAKGAWQFIASTAVRYGLDVGPLKDIPEYDPNDQRFDFRAATEAAAHFLRDLYKTDAEASGLLVMASYNWGPANIINRIRQMPDNPRDRNFWKLLQEHRIPKETYDYVFYIFSAAVIGENPRLFGFDFDNPLQGYDKPGQPRAGA